MQEEQVRQHHDKAATIQQNQMDGNNNFLKQVEAQQEQQLELQMLTQQCQQLINKAQQSFLSNQQQQQSVSTLKQDKSRLQKQFLDLCIQIQRQQKQLQNYKFKIRVANKQAQYYSRQIKQKEQILKNLQKHQQQQTSRRKSFVRK